MLMGQYADASVSHSPTTIPDCTQCNKSVFSLSTAAVNVTLLAFAAVHQQQTRHMLLQRSIDGTDRQTDTVLLHKPCCMLCEQCQQPTQVGPACV